MPLIDTHAHLYDDAFDGKLSDVLGRALDAGVEQILTIGISAETSRRCVEIAATHQHVHAVVGIQPNCCGEVQPADWDEVVHLARDEKVVALGETGLDHYWDKVPLALQQDYFDRHLRLSQQTGLPFVIHMRDGNTPGECADAILEMLREAQRRGPLRGVMHSFTGDAAAAAECVEIGLHVSFAGMATFKKAEDLRQVAAGIPTDRVLVETDAPYLSPEPLRGKYANEPARVTHTARRLAAVRGEGEQAFAQQTTQNAKCLFGLT